MSSSFLFSLQHKYSHVKLGGTSSGVLGSGYTSEEVGQLLDPRASDPANSELAGLYNCIIVRI